MIEFLNILKDTGHSSLSIFWFPLALWTVLVVIVVLIMKYSTRIHAIYQYHSRAALLLALPVGLFTSFAIGKLVSAFSASERLTTKFIVIQSPVTVSAAEVNQALSWSDPMLWAGFSVILFALVAAVCLIKLTADFIVLRRFSHSLDKSLLSELPLISASNLDLAKNGSSGPGFAFTNKVQVPFTFGWLNTTIVLPEALKSNTEKLNLALRHELMHIKHRDYLLNNLLVPIKALFWFHPLVHYLYKEFKEYREISCDSEVLADSTISRKRYAELLLELASKEVFQNSRTVSMAVNPSTLKKRIQVMTHQSYSSKIFRSSIILALISTLSITGIIACSDMQSSGITNRDVADVQRNIQTAPADDQPLYIINGERMNLEESGGIISRIKPKYIETIDVLKGENAIDEYGEAGKNGAIKIQLLDKEKAFNDLLPAPPPVPPVPQQPDVKEDFFVVVEDMPELIGGLEAIQKNLRYPETARKAGIEGRVIVQFIVNEQGDVETPQIIRGIGGGCDEEALNVVKQAKFKPGRQRGKPVRVQYSLPIIFKLPGSDTIQKKSSSAYIENPTVDSKEFVVSNIANDNSGVISGKLTDVSTGKPLPGANIIIEGTTTGTSTDSDGEFQLRDVPPGNQELSISYIGYQTTIMHLSVK